MKKRYRLHFVKTECYSAVVEADSLQEAIDMADDVESGYTVDIKEEDNSKVVRFNGKYATKESNEKIQAWYSLEWSNEEIKKDIATKLLKWSGLKLKTVLDY